MDILIILGLIALAYIANKKWFHLRLYTKTGRADYWKMRDQIDNLSKENSRLQNLVDDYESRLKKMRKVEAYEAEPYSPFSYLDDKSRQLLMMMELGKFKGIIRELEKELKEKQLSPHDNFQYVASRIVRILESPDAVEFLEDHPEYKYIINPTKK